jgi:hypothetical protein
MIGLIVCSLPIVLIGLFLLKKLKKYLVLVLVVIFLFALITPLILYSFGLFKDNGALHNSDVLSYYGSIIGGGITVLGIYLTFNFESEKLKEERRKDYLPILHFLFLPTNYTPEDIKQKSHIKKYKENDIVIDTTEEGEKYEENFIHEYGDLQIVNAGLGAAIISDVKLIRSKPKNVVVNNSSEKKFKSFILPKNNVRNLSMTIRSGDLNKDDTLLLIFMDLYSNEYSYKIPFNNINARYKKTRLVSTDSEIMPTLVHTK